MNSPQYALYDYIKNLANVENVTKHLYQQYNIMTKDYPEEDMTVYYNKYDNKHKSNVEMATRSVIMSNSTNQVVCYTCPTPIYNMEAIQYLWRNQEKKCDTYVCYEGSLMSVFFHNEKWYVATRKNIYQNNSEQTGHFKMFMEVLNNDNYETFDDFTKYLNKNMSYHFVLIHHLNEHIVDYTFEFGQNYKKLCFIFSRDKLTQNEIKSEDVENTFVSDNIFLPKVINEIELQKFISILSDINVNMPPTSEGLVIKINGNILKLQSSTYQFYKAIGSDKNMFKGFLNLYQSNALKKFLSLESNEKFQKIVNPQNTSESFDTIGMIDALFKVITAELYNLFYLLWNDNGGHQNKDLYGMLPAEYKEILFHLRGIYFSNKMKNHNDETVLRMKDVYNFIKSVDISLLEKFIRSRKLMLNWTRHENNENVTLFNKSLYKCEKVYYKLTAIYTGKLFPEIMPDDLPVFN